MPKKTYYLQEAKQDPLQTEWGFAWKNFTIKHNGQVVGVVENQKQLKQVNSFSLSDGRQLQVQLKTGMNAHLDIQVDGKPLPGSGGDPLTKVKAAAIYTWCIAGLMVILSAILMSIGGELGEFGIFGILEGLIFVGLGFWIWISKSMASIIVALVLAGIQSLVVVGVLAASGGRGIGGIAIKVLWIVTLVRAISGAKELANKKEVDLNSDILDA